MIFVICAEGQLIHASSIWTALTGQSIPAALGQGWLDRVHPEDRRTVENTIQSARQTAADFSVRYRLLKPNDSARWVGAGGVPLFGMSGSTFLGYLGSITELADGATDTITAWGNVERFAPPKPHPNTMPSHKLDLVADHLLIAHTMIEEDGGKAALPDLREALFKIGQALAARTAQQITLN